MPSVKNAFGEAVQQLVDVAGRIPPEGWEKPGLGEWTVRELLSHVVGAIEAPIAYAGQARPIDMDDAAEYYISAMASPSIHQEVAERARQGVERLGDDPASALRAVVARTLAALEEFADDDPMSTSFGRVRLVDYLPTRILEVVVHTLDIAAAAGIPVEPPPAALRVSLALLGDIAVRQGEGATLALALSGRRSLPEGYNVLG